MIMIELYIILAQISIIYMITFQSSASYPLYHDENYTCNPSKSVDYNISFPKEFERIPQVIINLWRLNMTSGRNEIQASVYEVEKKQFTFHLACPSEGIVSQYRFKWIAIDDQRIQIINCFNLTNVEKSIYFHNNPNALKAFITITSIGYDGNFEFFMKVFDINATSITIDFVGNIQNLFQIGYQIIMGVEEAFIELQDEYFTKSFQSDDLTLESRNNNGLLLNYYGFNYSNTGNLDQQKTTDVGIPAKYYIYKIFPYSGASHNIIFWIKKAIPIVFYPIYLSSLKIIQMKEQYDSSQPHLIIVIEKTNLHLKIVGSYTTVIDKSIDFIIIELIVRCREGHSILSRFQKLLKLTSIKQFYFSYQCNQRINQVVFKANFTKQSIGYQELIINILENSCVVSQVLYNQIREEVMLFTIYLNG